MNSKEMKSDVQEIKGLKKTLIVAEMASEQFSELKEDLRVFNETVNKHWSELKMKLSSKGMKELFLEQMKENLSLLGDVKSFHSGNAGNLKKSMMKSHLKDEKTLISVRDLTFRF